MTYFYLTILLCLGSLVANGQNFPTHQVDSNAHAIFADLQLVDLDADLDLDIIVAPNVLNSIWWYENKGNGVLVTFNYLHLELIMSTKSSVLM